MRTLKFALVSLATVGCIVAQEPKNQRKTEPGKLDFTSPPFRPQRTEIEPGKLDFTFPRRPLPEKRFLDFTFPAIKPLIQGSSSHQNIEPGKLDFTLRPQGSPTPQERLLRPNRKIRLVENPSPCAIPLLEAQIPKNNDFTIRQIRPRMDKLVPMPNVKVPAPACVDRSGTGSPR